MSHKKSYSGRNGLLFLKMENCRSHQTPKKDESILGASLQTEKNYSPNGDLISKKTLPNFLRTKNIDILNPYK